MKNENVIGTAPLPPAVDAHGLRQCWEYRPENFLQCLCDCAFTSHYVSLNVTNNFEFLIPYGYSIPIAIETYN